MTHPITKEQQVKELAEFIHNAEDQYWLDNKGFAKEPYSSQPEAVKSLKEYLAQAILDKVFEGAVKGKVVQSKDPFDSDPKNEPFVMATTYDGACKLLQFLCESGGVIVLLAPAQDAKAAKEQA